MSRRQQPRQPPRTDLASVVDVEAGLKKGLSMFAVGYLVMFVFFFVEMGAAGGGTGGGLVVLAAPFGFLFSSHVGAVPGGFAGGMGAFLTIPVVVYYLVPILLLGWGGYDLGTEVADPRPVAKAVGGMGVTAGYLAGVVLTFVVLSLLPGGSLARFARRIVQVLIVAGVLYPAVLGGAGGYVAHLRHGDAPPVRAAAGRSPADGQAHPQRGSQGGLTQGGQRSPPRSNARGQPQQGGTQARSRGNQQPQGRHDAPDQPSGAQPTRAHGQQSGQSQGQPTCADCGSVVDPGGEFCRHCGAIL